MRITSIGAGNMATAIIKSVISSGRLNPKDITVFDINTEKYSEFRKISVNCADSIEEACASSEMILLAVKPQDYEKVLLDLKKFCNDKNRVFISIAAAISTDYICKTLGKDF